MRTKYGMMPQITMLHISMFGVVVKITIRVFVSSVAQPLATVITKPHCPSFSTKSVL